MEQDHIESRLSKIPEATPNNHSFEQLKRLKIFKHYQKPNLNAAGNSTITRPSFPFTSLENPSKEKEEEGGGERKRCVHGIQLNENSEHIKYIKLCGTCKGNDNGGNGGGKYYCTYTHYTNMYRI